MGNDRGKWTENLIAEAETAAKRGKKNPQNNKVIINGEKVLQQLLRTIGKKEKVKRIWNFEEIQWITHNFRIH